MFKEFNGIIIKTDNTVADTGLSLERAYRPEDIKSIHGTENEDGSCMVIVTGDIMYKVDHKLDTVVRWLNESIVNLDEFAAWFDNQDGWLPANSKLKLPLTQITERECPECENTFVTKPWTKHGVEYCSHECYSNSE